MINYVFQVIPIVSVVVADHNTEVVPEKNDTTREGSWRCTATPLGSSTSIIYSITVGGYLGFLWTIGTISDNIGKSFFG